MTDSARRRKASRIKDKIKRKVKPAPDEVAWLRAYEAMRAAGAPVPSSTSSSSSEPRVYTTDKPPDPAPDPALGPEGPEQWSRPEDAHAPPPDGAADGMPHVEPDASSAPSGARREAPPDVEPEPPGALASMVATGLTLLLKRGVEHDLRPILAEDLPEVSETERNAICDATIAGYHELANAVCAKYLNGIDIPYVPEGIVLGGAGWGVSTILRARAARKKAEQAEAEKRATSSAGATPTVADQAVDPDPTPPRPRGGLYSTPA